jgi:hypothetical protein
VELFWYEKINNNGQFMFICIIFPILQVASSQMRYITQSSPSVKNNTQNSPFNTTNNTQPVTLIHTLAHTTPIHTITTNTANNTQRILHSNHTVNTPIIKSERNINGIATFVDDLLSYGVDNFSADYNNNSTDLFLTDNDNIQRNKNPEEGVENNITINATRKLEFNYFDDDKQNIDSVVEVSVDNGGSGGDDDVYHKHAFEMINRIVLNATHK